MMKVLFAVLLFLMCCTPNKLWSQIKLDKYLAAGKAAYTQRDYTKAIFYFDAIIQAKSEDHLIYFFRGICKFANNQAELAVSDFTQSIELNPFHLESYYYRGKIKSMLHDYYGALSDFDKSLEISAIDKECLLERGRIHLILNNTAEAIADFDLALRVDKSLGEAYYLRSIARFRRFETEAALADLDKAIQINPFDERAFVFRGQKYTEKEEYGLACDDFNRALRLNDKNVSAYFGIAISLTQQEMLDSAYTTYGMAIAIDPEFEAAYYNRGVISSMKEEWLKAKQDLDIVLQLSPTNLDAYFNRGVVNIRLGRFGEAIKDNSEAIDLLPEHANAFFNRAYAKRALGDNYGAWEDMVQVKRLNAKLDSIYEAGGIVEVRTKLMQRKKDKDFRKLDNNINLLPGFILADPMCFVSIGTKPYRPVGQEHSACAHYVFGMVSKLKAQENSVNGICVDGIPCTQLSNAIGYLAALNYNGAMACLDSLIGQGQGLDWAAYLNKATIRYEMIHYINSMELYGELAPKAVAGMDVGDVKLQIDYSMVLDDLDRAIILDPSQALSYYNRANIRGESNRYLSAIEDYNTAIKLQPAFAEAYFNRGLIALYLKNMQGCTDLGKAGELGIKDAYSVIKKLCVE